VLLRSLGSVAAAASLRTLCMISGVRASRKVLLSPKDSGYTGVM
jgi:hypothetical protein